MKFYIFLAVVFLFLGCEDKEYLKLDGEKLIQQKCSQCHNLDLPPKTFENEVAPPMMAVAFHVKDFMKVSNESERIPKAIDFVVDYVLNPSKEKSLCDEKSLKSYGLMPSQKGKVTKDELRAIATYMFEHFNLKNLQEAQAIKNRLKHMPKGERLAIKYNCLTCHKKQKDLVGPSFKKIASKYHDKESIKNSILNGSKGKWGKRVMPSFKNKINKNDIETLSKWITSLK
jgi:cytochrome c